MALDQEASTPGLDAVDAATAGLFFSWLAHDLEEYATMPGRQHPFVGALPFLPEDVRRNGPSREQVCVALSLVGALMAAASIDGYRTRGRSGFYQSMLFGYGMHTFIHLGSAVLARGYTSGSATALPVVLPFWLFARSALKADGVRLRPRWWTLAAFPVVGVGVHSAGYLVARRWRKARLRREQSGARGTRDRAHQHPLGGGLGGGVAQRGVHAAERRRRSAPA